jgi:hypothetical protein
MKRLAIMQPYFLPYIGYFQLMSAVDKFVILDDANFINRGWINRNRLLLNGVAHTFTIPLRGASQNRRIFEIELDDRQSWRDKLLHTVRHAYCKAPCYARVRPLMERVIGYPSNQLDAFLLNSLREVAQYLPLDVDIVSSARVYGNAHLKGEQRILDICRQEGADVYVNPIGGIDLYDRGRFSEHQISLQFLRSRPLVYAQGNSSHVPWLSMLDVLMYNDADTVRRLLGEMDLV